jgi:hypothetical protein
MRVRRSSVDLVYIAMDARKVSRRSIAKEGALHFRDELRAARAAALRDREAFQEIVVVLEKLGAYLTKDMGSLGGYLNALKELAARSTMADEVPSELSALHQEFEVKYGIIRRARNAAVHEGALERAFLTTFNCRLLWAPSSIRQKCLRFSFHNQYIGPS